MEISIARDRNGEFEPRVARSTRGTQAKLEDQIVAMHAKGMATRNIEDHLRDIYEIEVSSGLVNKVTYRFIPLVTE